MLEREGVRIIVPGTLPVARQIAIFRRAQLVIGPHGAGLSNIMGCEPGTHLYEFVPSHYPNICFNRLAQTCGVNYWGDVFPAEAGAAGPHERNWHVDLDVVARRLAVIRTRIAATMPPPTAMDHLRRNAVVLLEKTPRPAERAGLFRRLASAFGFFRR